MFDWIASWFRRHRPAPPADPSPPRAKSYGSRKMAFMSVPYGGRTGWNSWTADRYAQVKQYKGWNYIGIRALMDAVARHPPLVAEVIEAPANRVRHLERLRRKALTAVQPHEDLEPVGPDHPLARLLRNPNGPYTQSRLYRRTALFLELTGTAYWWVVPDPDTGMPAEIWVLPSHWVWPVVGGDNFVSEYILRPLGAHSLGLDRFPAADVIEFHHDNPLSEIDGASPLGACDTFVDSARALEQARSTHYQYGPMPGGVFELSEDYADPTQEEIDAVRERMRQTYGGPDRAGNVVIAKNGEKFTPTTLGPDVMGYQQSGEQLRDMNLAISGVPAIIAGISKEMTFGSVAATQAGFYQFKVNPLLALIDEIATEKLASRYPGSLRIYHLDETPLDPQTAQAELESDWQADALTVNERRKLRGRDPFDWGDVTKSQLAAKMQAQAKPPPAPPGGAEPPQTPGVPGEDARDLFAELGQRPGLNGKGHNGHANGKTLVAAGLRIKAGFTGTITDRQGGRYTYQDGTCVSAPPGAGPRQLEAADRAAARRHEAQQQRDATTAAAPGRTSPPPAPPERMKADATGHDDDTRERAELIAELLTAVYGDEALKLFDAVNDSTPDEDDTREKAWDAIHHPRGEGGRFIPKNSPEAHAAAKEAIGKALKEKPTPEGLKGLTEHLSILTVAQLHDLRKEHGLSASGRTRAELVGKIADRLHRGRRGTPEAGGGHPSYAEGQAQQREQAKLREQQGAAQPPQGAKPAAPAAPSPEEFQGSLGRAFDHLRHFQQFRHGVVHVPRLYHQMKEENPNLTPDQFKKQLQGLWDQGVIELKVLNERGEAMDPHLAPTRQTPNGEDLLYFMTPGRNWGKKPTA